MELKKKKEHSLAVAPKGTVRLITSSEKTQFYYRSEPSVSVGTYIPQKNIALAQALAQKDYDQRVLRSIEQEIKAIDTYLAKLPKRIAEDIYEGLHLERQKIITPIRETDEQFVQRWEQITYEGKEIDEDVPLLLTERGERVRSKSEMLIADMLFREGIPYRYEYPIYLKGYGKVHPDFTVLNIRKRKEIYWEHLGMMDDPVYAEKNLLKLKNYKKNGIVCGENLILTWETKNLPINQGDIRREIEKYLK